MNALDVLIDFASIGGFVMGLVNAYFIVDTRAAVTRFATRYLGDRS